MVTVAMPAASKMWASVLTVRVQRGQTGVREDDVHLVLLEEPSRGRAAVHANGGEVELVAGEGEMHIGHLADGAVLGHLFEPVDGEHDVEVGGDAAGIEVGAPMPHYDVAPVSMQHAIAGVDREEVVVILVMQRGGGDQRNFRLGERRGLDECGVGEVRAGNLGRAGLDGVVAHFARRSS